MEHVATTDSMGGHSHIQPPIISHGDGHREIPLSLHLFFWSPSSLHLFLDSEYPTDCHYSLRLESMLQDLALSSHPFKTNDFKHALATMKRTFILSNLTVLQRQLRTLDLDNILHAFLGALVCMLWCQGISGPTLLIVRFCHSSPISLFQQHTLMFAAT